MAPTTKTSTPPRPPTNSFSYNAFGARVSKTDSSGTSTYARNGVSVVAPVLSDGTLTFTPGISSRSGSDSTWSQGDIKNSLRQTSENESTTGTKQFDAFGNETTSTGTWQSPFQYGGNFGYQTDSDSNLKLLGHRYYDSGTGRFLSRDPSKQGENWLLYSASAPLAHADPDGLVMVTVILATLVDPRPQRDGIPPKPSDVRIGVNIAEAWRLRKAAETPGFTAGHFLGMTTHNLSWFTRKVRSGGEWDFKKLDPAFADFGNFHYGIIGAALGIELEVLLRAAGYAHRRDNPGSREMGHPLTGPPYGDDPDDQEQIKAGYQYYQQNYEPFRY